ncbi:MAG: hypothetical protein RL071_1626, partial [Pseudomonadota bacterium]
MTPHALRPLRGALPALLALTLAACAEEAKPVDPPAGGVTDEEGNELPPDEGDDG